MSLFKACDVRGVVGVDLNEEITRKIGRALGTMIDRGGGGSVYLAGDFRRSTPALKQSLQEGLREAGVDVKDIGQAPTPVAYFAAARNECGNVAIVTASHNAGRYNGVKFMVAGQPATPPFMNQLQALLETPVAAQCGKPVEPGDVLDDYEAAVPARAAEVSGVETPVLASRRLKIVLDAMGGAFSDIAPRVLRKAGCQVVPLHCTIDQDYSSREPNPAVDSNLAELSQQVAAEQADFGAALDGDGDRAAFVDCTGRILRPEQIGSLLIERCFPRPTVVFDLKCSSVLAKATRAAGGTCLMQPSGYGFIKTAMIEHRADFGVEVSGHYFFRVLNGGDDGLFVVLLMAHLVAGSGLSLAELTGSIGWPAITPDLRLPLPGDAAEILERIATHCGGEVLRLDGVRAEYADGWALARLSITEPLITFRFEADRRENLPKIAAKFLHCVPDLCKQVLESLR